MKFLILCFNKISKEYKEIYEFYINKIKKFCNIEVIEIEEEFFSDSKKNMKINEDNLIKKLKNYKDFEMHLLEINTKQYDSLSFSKIVEQNKDFNNGKIGFIIGPSDGFSVDFKNKIAKKLSFGLLTMPHLLVRIILLEQIYRAFKIIRNETYHK
ncbi:23S rRNA (pseudouridine(1915)-N(3))-methyltransferase RlmH [Spiroplasma tabanidicola]|uniref:Ribosomal RNA large subunit methyltransferase H n=1 Tax=Spiroplasma tabanidicola TaxID=324079 RepID=A0A6I6C4M4_9MOLU|nr:23S rRNA (pseudouridine(1915)-N(3))-methyltransferase RlmH [Spiroplasma tabanidicola]QGS51747.1 23S rRNA (pseudouridine1915-N3)-methyltransferase [Spiroplasma tabanidicola]